ncbi:hypothetical protein QVD17_33171 [Tagetes erecta]|uniref:FBD domain-containing protein n=1 Tax=Tagetes erecta TaxID=13708 RepID=A0AAD8NL62_TARER|nr:hypothetical protein QVD17_33171 [Tagetes erecta]
MSSQQVDRLSGLPEDVRFHILSLMPAKFAGRTSVLSKRWRFSWMFVTNLDYNSKKTMSSKYIDRLSGLPKHIRSHILSLMPTRNAIKTSVLSQTWRYTWMLVTNLNFDDYSIHDFKHFETFVDCVLKHCITSQLNLFRLHQFRWSVGKPTLSNWINEAVRLNVRELDIKVFQLGLPLSLFTCKTLTNLRLSHSEDDKSGWECPCLVYLPCLKNLDVNVFGNPFVNAFKLISGSPILESLSLVISSHNGEEDYVFNIPTLKRLNLYLHDRSNTNKVVLNVPNLESLFVGGKMCSLFVMEDVSSLVAATIKCHSIFGRGDMWVELLKGVSGVKSLSIGNLSSILLPTFPIMSTNMKQLVLQGFWHPKEVVGVLESCPGLEHLHIQMFAEFDWIEPKLVPGCMLTKLTSIKISNCIWSNHEMKFLEYMLGNAEVLKTVTITWVKSWVKEESQLRAKLLKLPRASKYCQVNFPRDLFK